MFEYGYTSAAEAVFRSKAGTLTVKRDGDLLAMDFPPRPIPVQSALSDALGAVPGELYESRDFLAVFDRQADVEALRPDFSAIAKLDTFAVIATAPGEACDFVSRFFAPKAGVPEDPVTGSAHCTLVPYWSKRLGKADLYARQVSKRGGELYCRDRGERVTLAGQVVEYLRGEIRV